METTRVAHVTFDGVGLTKYFDLSCPFPVSSVEVSLISEIAIAHIDDRWCDLRSTLVDNESLGVVPIQTTPFQSRFHRYTFSQPKNIQGRYTITTHTDALVGTVYVIVIMKQ